MPSTTEAARLQRIRRKAERQHQSIWKVREGSPYYAEYGPYAIRNMEGRRHVGLLIAQGLDLDALEREYEITTYTEGNDA